LKLCKIYKNKQKQNLINKFHIAFTLTCGLEGY
jgi:hypothetical protein